MNQHAKLGQIYISSKVIYFPVIDGHTNTRTHGLIALHGPLQWSAEITIFSNMRLFGHVAHRSTEGG